MGEYYQLKDVQTLSWTNNAHPIAEDFRMQHAVCSDNGETIKMELVVSRVAVKDALEADRPADLDGKVRVHHFEKADSINKLLDLNAEIHDAITKMCALKHPTRDKLETVGTILLGAWNGSNQNQVTLEALLDRCYQMSPHYIKGFDNRITAGLRNVFKGIPDFNYMIENGYILWRYRDTDQGTLSYQIGSKEFINWENEVLHANPEDFYQLETFLL